jgi:hypothetical protein
VSALARARLTPSTFLHPRLKVYHSCLDSLFAGYLGHDRKRFEWWSWDWNCCSSLRAAAVESTLRGTRYCFHAASRCRNLSSSSRQSALAKAVRGRWSKLTTIVHGAAHDLTRVECAPRPPHHRQYALSHAAIYIRQNRSARLLFFLSGSIILRPFNVRHFSRRPIWLRFKSLSFTRFIKAISANSLKTG